MNLLSDKKLKIMIFVEKKFKYIKIFHLRHKNIIIFMLFEYFSYYLVNL